MDMQVEEITQILRESPSVRLIKSRSVDFFLSFVIEAFEGQSAIMQERLHMLLENRLDEQENALVEDNLEMTRLGESNEQKAKRLIKDWTDKGFLTNYQNEEGEVIYEISSHTSKLMDWVVSLKKEDYIGTESKFKTLFAQLKELVEYSNEDREKRLELLRAKKMEIEHQIQRLEMGEEVEVYEDYQIEPRYNSLNKLAKELLSDFKEVDDNFKGIIKEIYERQTDNAEKKVLLNYIFDAYGELKQSQQGKSFYAFWEFLLSADLQKEWDELTGVLYETLENRGIDAHDMFLREMKKHLFDAGEKVAKTNDRMSEKLSRIIRQNGQMNAEVTKQVINDIKKLLIEATKQKEKPEASLEYETIDINLPVERPLTLAPIKETVYKDKPDMAELSLDDFDRISREIPYLCNLKPSGEYPMEAFHEAGGVQTVLKALETKLDLDQLTVTGKTLGANLKEVSFADGPVIHSLDHPKKPEGGIAILYGNLAPKGAVVKKAGVKPSMYQFTGTARVFNYMEDACRAIQAGEIPAGTVIVLRYEGPKGGPGMREQHMVTSLLVGRGMDESCALITDGRFSGSTRGPAIGHISPEAAAGGPIATVQDGDTITIDIPGRKLTLHLSAEEIQKRLAQVQLLRKPATPALQKYAALVTSADRGAILEIPECLK